MARFSGPKNKLARQVGADLGLKTNAVKVAKRLMIRPGQHGQKRRRKLSDFGVQLREKQKVKYIYGILEKQLRRSFSEAAKDQTSTGAALLTLLERRLDNVVYRAGWAPTRAAARQLVSHNHVQVNNRKMNVPSYRVNIDDVIKLKPKATKIPVVAELLKETEQATVGWLNRKQHIAQVARLPHRDDIVDQIQEQLIVEYYSR